MMNNHVEICIKGSECGAVVKNHKTGKIYLFNSFEDARKCIDVRPERNSSNCGKVSNIDDTTTACSKETSTPSE
jgi:hypothetical protein